MQAGARGAGQPFSSYLVCGSRAVFRREPQSEAVGASKADDVARLKVDGDDLKTGGSGDGGRADVTCDLTDAEVDGKARIGALGPANGIVKRSRDATSAWYLLVEVFDVIWLLGEACGRNEGSVPRARQWEADAAEPAASEARGLAAETEDGGVSHLEAKVEKQRKPEIESGFGSGNVDVFVVVGGVGNGAGDKGIVEADDKTGAQAGHPVAMEGVLLQDDCLAVEDVHAAVVPKAAEIWVAAVGVNAAGIAELGEVVNTFRDADGLHIPDDRSGADEVVAKLRNGKELVRCHGNNIRRGRDEATGLAFEGEILCARKGGESEQDAEQ